jgi:probable HAF family extracellular repeat protein
LPFLVLALLIAPSPAGAQSLPWFTGVGDLAGGSVESVALAVAAEGSVVVGHSQSIYGAEAFRWTTGGGISGLGFLLPSNPDSEATAVSGDGSVIAGTSRTATGDRAFRWTGGGGMLELGSFSCADCDPITAANGISGDGLVVVGGGLAKGAGAPHLDSARWPGGGTSIFDLGDLSGPASYSSAAGASQDGSLIVGEGESSSGNEAWKWTSGSSMQALVGIPGAQVKSCAQAVSSDASTIVGYANTDSASTNDAEAVRWTGTGHGTIETLGALPGAPVPNSTARAVSGDGSIIVGRAKNSGNSDRAFIWDAANGMRELATVLEEDYGLDLGGWILRDARGVSDVGVDGEFTVVGRGTNPSGDLEGWVAFLIPPACSDLEDNDLDGDTDFPDDGECTGKADLSEVADCDDGIDNDGDGDFDYPEDAECASAGDQTELPDCSDGIDNDSDGDTDHPDDPGCSGPDALIENPACDDTIDNDTDGNTDHPDDPGCTSPADLSEVPDCSDALDNDGDGDFDYPADGDCDSADDPSESPECSDGIDNDADGRTDYPSEYPDCVSGSDPREAPQCGDGIDNDLDGGTDLGDADCPDTASHNESPGSFAEGDLLLVDRASRAVFQVDPLSGDQTRLSEKAVLQSPEGIAQRADGTLVVADPTGLVEIDPVSGMQRIASEPLTSADSLQLVWDSSGDAFVLESSEISRVTWNPVGLGTKTTFLAVPTPEPIPLLGLLTGGTLVRESSGDLLTTGASLYGDGVFRVDVATQTASVLEPGFTSNLWLDLAMEDEDTVLGVGAALGSGPGVYRIDATTGAATPLSVGSPWVTPVAVARASGGEIYVADAGTCAGGSCSGGSIAQVDPISGARTPISTGGFIQGEMDIAIAVPEPGGLGMLLAGIACLVAVGRKRIRP